ncbi:hypothetical protein [Marilutibacter maris]|uniref:Uncharacterized protein n=1 Tax=Marilutibacter maris TaxID=1605891 RepID=A0A5N6CTU2_9GAMM|nr:hypothetical protein [Lysobacter maris]KAB8196208.1 hypothetical protein FKV24_004485 [Lysobacter maris]
MPNTGHPDRLLKMLLGIAVMSFLTLMIPLLAIPTSSPADFSPVAKGAFAIAATGCFLALLALWIYWLRHFWKTAQHRRFWLCLLVPYAYATYSTVKHLQTPSSGHV